LSRTIAADPQVEDQQHGQIETVLRAAPQANGGIEQQRERQDQSEEKMHDAVAIKEGIILRDCGSGVFF